MTVSGRGSRVILVFDKLRVTSLSGMGACQFGITHPAVGGRKLFNHNSMSRFQAGELQASSVHEPWETGAQIEHSVKGLILAQNERWRHGLGMQVERIPG